MNNFRLSQETRGALTFVQVTGSLDMENYPRLEDLLAVQIQQPHATIVLDCKNLQYIGSIGLGGLIKFSNQSRAQGGELKLVNVPERVYKIITSLGFTRVLQVYQTEDEALASLASPKNCDE